jgi:iron complex outermembrane receptor protein
LGYKQGKVSFYGSYNYSSEKAYSIIDQERQLPGNNYYRSHTYSDFWRVSNNIKLEGTYDISKSQYISLYYIYQPKSGADSVYSNSNVISQLPSKSLFSTGTFPNLFASRYSNIGLNYNIQTDTSGSKFTLVADYTSFKEDANSYTNSKTYNSNNNKINDTAFGFFYPNISKILTTNISFNKILSKSLSFSIGGKLTKTDISNDNYYNILSIATWSRPKGLDLNYRYYEDIYAGYVNFKGVYRDINFQLGLRGEQSDVDGKVNAINKDTTLSSRYFNLFPTLYLLKNLDSHKDLSLTLSYNKRIERPTYSDLTPYKYYIDNFSVQQGNPYLKPQFTNAFEGGLSYKQKYNFSLGYNYTNNVISTVIKTDPNDATMIVSTENVGKNRVYSANFSAQVKMTKWWNATNNLLLTHTLSNSSAFQLKQSSFLIQSEQDVQISKRANLSINAHYTPHVLEGNIITNRMASVDVGFRMKFLGDRLLAKAAISDIFYTDNFKATSYYYESKLNLAQKLQTRVFSLSLIYNFQIGKAFQPKEIEKSNESEQKRLK